MRSTASYVSELEPIARAAGQRTLVLNASNDHDLEAAFAMLVQNRADAVVVAPDPFLDSRPDRVVALAAHHAVPAIYQWREFVAAGGLISYGTSLADAHRQQGVYVGSILKGTRPPDLPVIQPTKFELVINLKTAKALGLTVPLTLQARADEVIE
jgi:putative ABC transport system substrate-binding protein